MEIRTHFEDSPYGWPRDAVDGGIQVLLVAGLVIGQDERGQRIDPKMLERKAIGKTSFKMESTTVRAEQRIQIRKLFLKAGIQTKSNEELASTPQFIQKMQQLAEKAGGDAPKPLPPDISLLEDIRLAVGNEQLLAIYNRYDELEKAFDDWSRLSTQIEKRWPSWLNLLNLLEHADGVKAALEARQQARVIEDQRFLLNEPDPVLPLVKSLGDALRTELVARYQRYKTELNSYKQRLETDMLWQQLPQDRRDEILREYEIVPPNELSVRTLEELLYTLDRYPIHVWNDRIYALPSRFTMALDIAARELEPSSQTVDLPHRTIKTNEEMEKWLQDVRERIRSALTKGTVVIR